MQGWLWWGGWVAVDKAWRGGRLGIWSVWVREWASGRWWCVWLVGCGVGLGGWSRSGVVKTVGVGDCVWRAGGACGIDGSLCVECRRLRE